MHPTNRFGQPPVLPKQPLPQPPANYFSQFIEQSALERRGTLDSLRGKKIGVDGAKLIDNINQVMRENEKLATLTSPIPCCAYSEVGRIYEALTHQGVLADFVFPGMGLTFPSKDKERPRGHDHNVTVLSFAGRQVTDQQKIIKAAEELQATIDEDAENYIFLYMKYYGNITVTRSPYWSWAQIASYFNQATKYIDMAYGCHEMLAFQGIDQIITRIESDGYYYYVTKADLIAKLNQQFRFTITDFDLPFIVGATSSHRLLNDPFVQNLTMADLFQRLTRDASQALSLANHSNIHPSLGERIQRTIDGIRLCPILLPDGRCVPLCFAFNQMTFSKRRVVDLFGEPLPPMYYFMQMSGLLSPSVLSTVATKKIVDAAPVVDSPEYRAVAEFIIPLRTQIVYQLVQSLQRPAIEITWVRRYNREANSRELPILQPPQIRLDEWNTLEVTKASRIVFFTDVLRFAQGAVGSMVYQSTDAAYAAILLKILDLLGYFTHATQSNSPEVSGPSVYSTALDFCKIPSLSEYAVLLIELIRTKTLTEKHLFYPSKQGTIPTLPTLNTVEPHIIFASRLLSIFPLRQAKPWTGPICSDLCGFSGMARSVQRTLRSLTEVIAVITHCDNLRERPQFTSEQFHRDVQQKLPFSTPLMCEAGVVVQYMMENQVNNVPALLRVFPDCTDLPSDLGTIAYFWYYAGQIIRVLTDDDPNLQPVFHLYFRANILFSSLMIQMLGGQYTFLNEFNPK